jgi:hypothetical protein
MTQQITLKQSGNAVILEEGDTILSFSTADPEAAQAIYEEISAKVRRLVAGIF